MCRKLECFFFGLKSVLCAKVCICGKICVFSGVCVVLVSLCIVVGWNVCSWQKCVFLAKVYVVCS